LLCRTALAIIAKIFGRKYAIKIMALTQKKIGEYDVAISYLQNGNSKNFYGGCNEFVLKHVIAKKKISFVHCDFLNSGADNKENRLLYPKFDLIVTCSKGCHDTLLKAIPFIEEKSMIVNNFQNYHDIKKKAMLNEADFANEFINIVTVSRLSREKGVLRAINAISQIKDVSSKVRYYVIGDGIEKQDIVNELEKNALEKTVILCGELDNPYGYMKGADLLLIPSYHEAAPLVINEAASLGTPILSTRTASAKDMIEDTGFGWTCENSVDGITKKLSELIENKTMLENKKAHLLNSQYDNLKAREQLNNVIEFLRNK